MTVKHGAVLGSIVGTLLATGLWGAARLIHASQGADEGLAFAMAYGALLGLPTSALLAIPPLPRLLAGAVAPIALGVVIVMNWAVLGALWGAMDGRGRAPSRQTRSP